MRQFCLFLLPLIVINRPLAADEIDFTTQIKPLLSDRCFTCHGPDGESREAGLRLDLRDEAIKESENGLGHDLIIKPGDAAQSELIRRIVSDDPDEKMPPAEANLSLDASEIELLKRWVNQGAPFDQHWSFVPVRDVPVPDDSLASDAPAKADWAAHPIDRFVAARMKQHDLEPAPPASREHLIRRLSFDLNGLPPTLEEIDAFVNDRRPDAYERLVDRLLASERFGERMASEWLDVARYSDSYGYQVDRDRYVWPWRDWVIRAYNRNLPFDQFVTEQLAGDLLPDATDDQRLATTFNRLHPQKVEGGSTPEEFRIEYVADRTQTFATAFLGLTLECARCHDHKYDPLSQSEYYQLTAFFDNIDEAGLYSYFTNSVPTPTLILHNSDSKLRQQQAEEQVGHHEQHLVSLRSKRTDAFRAWLKNGRTLPTFSESNPSPKNDTQQQANAAATNGSNAEQTTESEGSGQDSQFPRADDKRSVLPLLGQLAALDFEDYKSNANQSVDGRIGKAVQLTGDDVIDVGKGNFRRDQPFSISLWMKPAEASERAVVFHRSRAWTDAASRGYELLIEEGKLTAALIHFYPGNAIQVRTRTPVVPNEWQHVVFAYDGSSRAGGLRLYLDGRLAETDVVYDNLYQNITGGGGDNVQIGQRFRDRGFKRGVVDEFHVYDRELTPIEVAQLHSGDRLQQLLEEPTDQLDTAEQELLYDYYLANVDAEYRSGLQQLQQARKTLNEVTQELPEIMVMSERTKPRETYRLNRGAYDQRRESVEPETPAILSPLDDDVPRNRLGLAQWLFEPDHPLTARVAVNRYWQLLFGEGLVRTPEDFGSQGALPTHPKLLDWLSRDFIDQGWNVKRLIKQIVMSQTYRQSTTNPLSAQRDPENRFWARAPSYRWPAEMLRDNALFVSGLLVPTVGGAPAKPYELEASFKPLKPDDGDGLYRRSLYTYWKRTGPAPVMMTLDASKRDVCRMKRERTASPLQALVMLNGPQFVEAAKLLGQRLIVEHPDDQDRVLQDLFRWLTGVQPDEKQLKVVQELYAWQLNYFQNDTAARDEFLATGKRQVDESLDATRLAATTAVANALMNYDGSLRRN